MLSNFRKLLFFTVIATSCLLITGCSDSDNSFQGYIAGTYTYISSPISGILDKLFIDRGQQVKKGDNVLYAKGAGSEIDHDGETVLIMREQEVYAVV